MPLTLDGRRTGTFPAFVDEVNRVLAAMPDAPEAPWNGTLDALADLLGNASGPVVWQHAEAARAALGHARMGEWLDTRVDFVHPTNRADLLDRLALARRGEGPTLFDTLADLMAASAPGGLRLDP